MTFNWKQALGSVALSAMALGVVGTDGAVAQTKPDTVKPTAPAAEKIETGQLRDKGKPQRFVTAKTGRPKERDDAARDTSSLLPVVGGVAGLAALPVAIGGGHDNPTSP